MNCFDTLGADELRGKRVFVRSDLNLPLNAEGEVADIFRLKRGWETIRALSERGARVIVTSHIGRKPEETLAPVARAIQQFGKVVFVPDIVGHVAHDAAFAMRDGDIILLENLRRDPREVENDDGFARELAGLAEVYVDDAFAAVHRAHASIAGVPKYLPHYAGLLLRDEVRELDGARTPAAPSFAILGGAKFETKAPLIDSLLASHDHLFIVGALANDVFKARGLEVGISLISKELPGGAVLDNPRFIAPVDVTVQGPDGQARVKKPEEVTANEKIVDIGPDSVAKVAPFIAAAKSILWNGPTGIFEEGFVSYTHAIAELLAESEAKKVIGGGDTIAAIESSAVPQEKLGFLSTGGGAMLEYLLKGTLPGIEALA